MARKKIFVKNATRQQNQGYIGILGTYLAGFCKNSMLPIPVVIVDEMTREEYDFQLITLVPCREIIPEVFKYLSFGENLTDEEVLQRMKKENVNQLAFYLYENQNRNSDTAVSEKIPSENK